MPDPKRELLRHAVATVAYRAGKTLRGAPPRFASFTAGPSTRTPAAILAHMGDLFDWALSLAEGKQSWHDSPPQEWPSEVERFYAAVAAFDQYLASDAPLACTQEKLLQGPIADSLTHTGQMAMLRRLAEAPVLGENYAVAEITTGRVGADQPAPRREFAS